MSDEAVMQAADEILRRSGKWQAQQEGADARQRTSEAAAEAAKAADAERKRRERAGHRAARVAAGAKLPRPLAPIGHRRLLNEGRELLGFMTFDHLKLAVDAIRAMLWSEVEVKRQPDAEPVEPLPEVEVEPPASHDETKADVFRRSFRTRELAQRAAVVAGLMADEFDVGINCVGRWRVIKPEEAERRRLDAEQDLADLRDLERGSAAA